MAIPRKKYRVSYGYSTYYKVQPENTKVETFSNKKKAFKFLATVNKQYDFSDIHYIGKRFHNY